MEGIKMDEMMENFAHILQRLPIATCAYSSSDHSGGTSPFKVQVNGRSVLRHTLLLNRKRNYI
jgi:hypothetical protein